MYKPWIAIVIVVAILFAIIAAYFLTSRSEGNQTVNLGVTGKMGPFGLLYSNGVERGIYDKYGLNVTYNRVNDAYTSMLALLTGKFDSISTSPGIFTSAYLDGENISIGMAMGLATNLMLIVSPNTSIYRT